MSARDMTALDTDMFQGLGRILQEAFEDGFDNDILLETGKKIRILLQDGVTYAEIYMDGTDSLVLPSSISESRIDDSYLYFGTSSDVGLVFDGTDFLVTPVSDDLIIKVGDGTNSMDLWWYGDTAADHIKVSASGKTITLDGFDLFLDDADILSFGDAQDVSVRWDGTDLDILALADDQVIKFGNGTNSFDIWIYGETANDNIIFNASDKILNFDGIDLQMEDSDIISFGDAKDITVTWDGTDLLIDGNAADTIIKIGATNNQDVWILGGTATNFIKVDTDDSALTVTFDGFDLLMFDADVISFGNAQDITITWDATDLIIDGAAADTVIKIGFTNNQDIIIYGDTTTDLITFDTSGELVTFNGFDLNLMDDDILEFGDALDFTMTWDGTDLIIDALAADKVIKIGFTNNLDIIVYGDTVSDLITFDTSAELVTFNGFDLQMNDDDKIYFGDSQEVSIEYDEDGDNDLVITCSNIELAAIVTGTIGVQVAATGKIPTADGTGTGTIASGYSMISITDGVNANCWMTLPAPVAGNILWLLTSAESTGFEIRTSDPATIALNGGSGAGTESAIAAAITMIRCVCVSSTLWICSQWDADGDESKVEAAA